MEIKIINTKVLNNFFKFIFIPAFILLVPYLLMQRGIQIDNFNIKFIKFEKLYIKLDKKLIFNVEKIQIAASKDPAKLSTLDELVKLSKNLKYLYFFFESFRIEELKYKDFSSKILYNKEQFYIDNTDFTILASIKNQNEKVLIDVEKFYFKRYEMYSKARLAIDLERQAYIMKGELYGKLLNTKYELNYKDSFLKYKLRDANTANITNILKAIKAYYPLPPHLMEWVGGKVVAKKYVIKSLEGKINLKTRNLYLNELVAFGYARDVSVVLGPGIKPITSPLVALQFKNQRLDFAYNELKFDKYDLVKSKLHIYKMLSLKAGIYLNIKTTAALDEEVQKILKLFHIKVPLIQEKGNTQANLHLKLDFKYPKKILYSGDFLLKDTLFNDLFVSSALIELRQKLLYIKEADIKHKLFSLNKIKAKLDLGTKEGEAKAYLQSLSLPKQSLELRDKNIRALIFFKDDLSFYFQKYKLILSLKEGLNIKAKALNRLYPHSALMQKYKLYDGELSLKTKDYKSLDIKIKDANISLPLLNKDKSPFNKDDFTIHIDANTTKLDTSSKKLKIRNNHFFIKDLIFISDNKNKPQDEDDFLLSGEKLEIFLKDFNKSLSFDKLEYKKNKDDLQIRANENKIDFKLFQNKKHFDLSFSNINDEYINKVMQKQVFKGGRFDLSLKGKNEDFIQGKFLLKDTLVEQMSFFRRLVSFIDTIPSLLLFKSSNFNNKGYLIEYGYVDFKRSKDLLEFVEINLQGKTIDILGSGQLNIRNKEIDLRLRLKTLKSTTQIISSIPIINKIILGDKQELSTSIRVSGSIDKPKFSTELVKDAVKIPVNLIKNIVELPVNILPN